VIPAVLLNLGFFLVCTLVLFRLARTKTSLSRRVLIGLVFGSAFGFFLQFVYGFDTPIIEQTLAWTNVVANGYVNLLRLIIMPLILITMIASILKVGEIKTLGSIGSLVVAVLLVTTMIAALIGVLMAEVFGLTAEGLTEGAAELAKAQELSSRPQGVASLSIPDLLVSFVSTNIFADLTGARDVSIISVVIFGLLFGVAAMLVAEENPERGASIRQFVTTTQAVVMRFVKLVIAMTPYGVLALMTRVIACSDGGAILSLISFVIASYLAIFLMFAVHALIIRLTGNNLTDYLRSIWPLLTFAFTTRSSAAAIPLSIRTQVDELAIPAPIANIAASFGATIGQNGCAGIYPAMLAVMVAPTVGIEIDAQFIATLVLIIALGSFGIAGVGGGATNAALVVLPAMGMPVTMVALLISIEPLIDMGRTALNVNGSVTAGLVGKRFLNIPGPQEAATK
jgi:L-cystine uptake protein TcyP (sodium:dicarboxylate symporter family)